MKSRKLLLFILAVVVFVAPWQLFTKRDLLTGSSLSSAWENLVSGNGEASFATAATVTDRSVDVVIAEPAEDTGPPVADPLPVIEAATEGEMYPFAPNTPVLETTVPLPEKHVPLVYFAYCPDSSNTFTSASTFFGEFLKYHVRSQKSSATLVNVI